MWSLSLSVLALFLGSTPQPASPCDDFQFDDILNVPSGAAKFFSHFRDPSAPWIPVEEMQARDYFLSSMQSHARIRMSGFLENRLRAAPKESLGQIKGQCAQLRNDNVEMMLRYESRIASLEKEKIKVEIERLKAQNRISDFDGEFRELKRCKDLEMQDVMRRLDVDYRRLIDEIKERWDRKQQDWEHHCAFRQHEANYNLISDFKQEKYRTLEDVMAKEERLLRKMEECRALFTEEPDLVVADLPFPQLPNVASEVLKAGANPVLDVEVDSTGVASVLASELPAPATAGEAQTVPVGYATVASAAVMQEPAIESEERTN